MNWYSTSEVNESEILCPRCSCSLNVHLPRADHHPVKCIGCNARLFVFSATARNIAIDVENAPAEFATFIGWAQDRFDELEFVSFFVSFEELLGIENQVS